MILPPQKKNRRGELNDRQWKRLRPLLPPQKPHTGCLAKDHRTIINGILWILGTAAPWRDLPGRYGHWSTVSGRFYHWRRIGLWQQLLEALQIKADAEGKINWDIHFVVELRSAEGVGSVIRAHQHAAGAKRGN